MMLHSSEKSQAGFTLIEMIVVVAIIAALAAILVPIVSSELSDAEATKALGDCQRIGAGITQFIKDTRIFPTGPLGDNTVRWLYGNGTQPATNPFNDGTKAALMSYLTNGTTNGGQLWNGPYLQDAPADPWGNSYIINVHGYYSGEYVWVISAGPNGKVDTGLTDTTLKVDDIGIMID
jgi:general secretion pathway protein G